MSKNPHTAAKYTCVDHENPPEAPPHWNNTEATAWQDGWSTGVLAATNMAAQTLGRLGGAVSSKAKTLAARENAKKGGWPKGKPRKPPEETLRVRRERTRPKAPHTRTLRDRTGQQKKGEKS